MKDLKLSKLSVVLCLAAVSVLGGCHKKKVAPPPPPPPPPPAPTAHISVSPTAINAGQTATITWSTTNASSATISGIGPVADSGSKTVSPSESTTYTLTAKGSGGTVEDSARLTLNAPPPPPPPPPAPSMTEEQMFEQNVKDVFFDYDKYSLRPGDASVAQQDADFLTKHPGIKILIAGHCDERGSEEYNIALGQNRAQSLQKALVDDGIAASRIRVISYGKEKPFCTESNEACWQQNRRDHLTIDK